MPVHVAHLNLRGGSLWIIFFCPSNLCNWIHTMCTLCLSSSTELSVRFISCSFCCQQLMLLEFYGYVAVVLLVKTVQELGNDLRCFGSWSWDPIFVSITLPLTLQWLYPLVLWPLSCLTSETIASWILNPCRKNVKMTPRKRQSLCGFYLHCFSFLKNYIFRHSLCVFPIASDSFLLFYLILITDFDKKSYSGTSYSVCLNYRKSFLHRCFKVYYE